jgi:hypothetical protein
LLRDATDKTWSTCIPKDITISSIKNPLVKVNCSKVEISGSDKTLTIKWDVTFDPAFAGTKNTYLSVEDDFGANVGLTKKGTWTITSK